MLIYLLSVNKSLYFSLDLCMQEYKHLSTTHMIYIYERVTLVGVTPNGFAGGGFSLASPQQHGIVFGIGGIYTV